MERLTIVRTEQPKRTYWRQVSTAELVQRLGEYEDSGLTPEEFGGTFTPNSCGKLVAAYLGTTWERIKQLVEEDK